MSGKNLDGLCAEYGYQIAQQVHRAIGKNAENLITKSLGVLQENGLYAFFLYQSSRGKNEEKGAQRLKELTTEMLKGLFRGSFDGNDPLEAIRGNPQEQMKGLADNLDDLLLAKVLIQQALIYARYHAKALSNVSPESQAKAQET